MKPSGAWIETTMRYTIRQAATALQVSDRTIRRAIGSGDLPAQREPWGGGERWTVDPGDLAAWAQVTGRPMTPLDNPRTTLDNEGGQAAAPIGSVPGVVYPAPLDKGPAEGRQTPAPLDTEGRHGVTLSTPAEVDTLRQAVRALETERDFLRRVLDNVTKALPAGNTGAEEADRWRDYAEELERWHSLGWWARRRHRRPEPPK